MKLPIESDGALPPTLESLEGDQAPYGAARCVVRGKELVLTVENVIVRINFGLEGHLFWMSMEEYTAITTVEPETYGTVGGRHYLVPTAILSEAVQRDVPIYLRPLMALIGETHILVVADHNALLKLTVGSLTRPVQDIDLLPTSDLYRHLWSPTHGPDWVLQSADAERGFWEWLSANAQSTTPIFNAIQDQSVANGVGTWHASDILHSAIIVPSFPVCYIAESLDMAQRLFEALKTEFHSYDPDWRTSTKHLPLVTVLRSSGGTFAFNEQGHKSWLTSGCKVYKKSRVVVTKDWIAKAKELGVLNRDWTVQPDGIACLEDGMEPSDRSTSTLTLPVRCYESFYTAIQARIPGQNYLPVLEKDSIDGPAFRSKTTIGPYSFSVFVSGRILKVPRGKPRVVRSGTGPGRPRKLVQSTIEKNISIPKYRKTRVELDIIEEERQKEIKRARLAAESMDKGIMTRGKKRAFATERGYSLSPVKKH